MEKLKNQLDSNNYIFKCSQCEKSLEISDNNFYCKNCKSDFCSSCIKGHNEIFMNHETVKAFEKQSNNSLLANPDLDLDDRQFIDNKLGSTEDMYSDITMLFHETVVSLEENFNEEICKLRDKLNKSIECGEDYSITYQLSIELDELIAQYYKNLKNNKKKLVTIYG